MAAPLIPAGFDFTDPDLLAERLPVAEFAELRRTAPMLPAVLVSGFTDRRVVRPEAAEWTEFLQKPFHPEELSAVVRRLVPV